MEVKHVICTWLYRQNRTRQLYIYWKNSTSFPRVAWNGSVNDEYSTSWTPPYLETRHLSLPSKFKTNNNYTLLLLLPQTPTPPSSSSTSRQNLSQRPSFSLLPLSSSFSLLTRSCYRFLNRHLLVLTTCLILFLNLIFLRFLPNFLALLKKGPNFLIRTQQDQRIGSRIKRRSPPSFS